MVGHDAHVERANMLHSSLWAPSFKPCNQTTAMAGLSVSTIRGWASALITWPGSRSNWGDSVKENISRKLLGIDEGRGR